jgi:hypothetical protein
MQFSPVAYGVSADLETTLAELYDRYVERYAGSADIPSRNDDEVWRVYEPVSFDLVEPNSVVDKANKWWGRSANLMESPERFQLHFLIGAPQNPRLSPAFARAHHILRKMSGDPELIMESSADMLAAELEREIGVHRDGAPNLFDPQRP